MKFEGRDSAGGFAAPSVSGFEVLIAFFRSADWAIFDTRRLNARDFGHQSRPTLEGQNLMWNQHYNSSEKRPALPAPRQNSGRVKYRW
jgi:hypothetical protein